MKRILGSILLLTAVILPSSSLALEFNELSVEEQRLVKNYVVGNVRFALLHEMGHMLIHQYKFPILGREEDAVDTFAAIVMLEAQTTATEAGLAYASQNWLVNSEPPSQTLDEQYADVYSLSKQRAFNLVCMMLGKDFDRFENFARLIGYPENSMGDCATRYDQARRTWIELLSPHVNEAEPSRIVVSNMEALGEQPENIRRVQEWIIGDALLKEVGGMISALFKIDLNLRMEAVYCSANGNPDDKRARNAYWRPSDSTIRYCYELGAGHYDNALALVQSERAKVQWLK